MNAVKKSPRRQERVLAFKVLYGLCFTPAATEKALEKAFAMSPDQPRPGSQPDGFAWELVKGVWQEQEALDAKIREFSQNWRMERIGKVELTLLRVAVYELLHRPDIPPKAAINEAIELSKQFGDDNSRGFVNGILDAAAKQAETR